MTVEGRLHGGCEIDALDVKSHVAAGEAIVEDDRQPVAGGDCGEQSACIAVVVKVMTSFGRPGDELVGAGDHLRRAFALHEQGSRRVEQALLGEFILRIEIQRRLELRQGLDSSALDQVAVSMVQLEPGKTLSCQFTRCQVVCVLRDQAGRFLKFVQSLVQILRFLEFDPARESVSGRLQVFRRAVTGGRPLGIGTERWHSDWRSV